MQSEVCNDPNEEYNSNDDGGENVYYSNNSENTPEEPDETNVEEIPYDVVNTEESITQNSDPENIIYDGFDDDEYEENSNELDDEALNAFLMQLFKAKRINIKKQREGKVLPSVKKYLKFNFEEKGKCKNLTPFVIKNLLNICDLMMTGKIPVHISHGDKGVIEHILDKDTLQEDIKFMLVGDFRIHGYIFNGYVLTVLKYKFSIDNLNLIFL